MLVLNRKKGESIFVGDNIQIMVVDVQGDNIKIGIEAPREVAIYREEIYKEIVSSNLEAARGKPGKDQDYNLLQELFKGTINSQGQVNDKGGTSDGD